MKLYFHWIHSRARYTFDFFPKIKIKLNLNFEQGGWLEFNLVVGRLRRQCKKSIWKLFRVYTLKSKFLLHPLQNTFECNQNSAGCLVFQIRKFPFYKKCLCYFWLSVLDYPIFFSSGREHYEYVNYVSST